MLRTNQEHPSNEFIIHAAIQGTVARPTFQPTCGTSGPCSSNQTRSISRCVADYLVHHWACDCRRSACCSLTGHHIRRQRVGEPTAHDRGVRDRDIPRFQRLRLDPPSECPPFGCHANRCPDLGTLVEAWASMKSFKRREGAEDEPPTGGGRGMSFRRRLASSRGGRHKQGTRAFHHSHEFPGQAAIVGCAAAGRQGRPNKF